LAANGRGFDTSTTTASGGVHAGGWVTMLRGKLAQADTTANQGLSQAYIFVT